MLLITICLTIFFAIKNKVWVTVSGSILAGLFIVDAWFDVLTSRPGHEQKISIFFGSLEVILAILTLKFVYHMVKGSAKSHDRVKLTAKPSANR